MRCEKCGRENPEDAAFCLKCGNSLEIKQPNFQNNQQYGPNKRRGLGLVIVGVVVIAIVLVLAVFAIGIMTNNGGNGGTIFDNTNHATLVVYLDNSHVAFTISYSLYIDGELHDTGTLSPGNNYRYTIPMSFSGDSITVDVYANTSGGGFGATSDSETIILTKDSTKQVTLTL